MTIEFLVIADPQDRGAASVTRRLTALHGGSAVLQLSPASLSRSRWFHTVSSAGTCDTRIDVPDGRTADDRNLRWVLNRMVSPPVVPAFRAASAKDQDYAAAEFQALMTSWLASLGTRVINPAGPSLLAGAYGPPLSWMGQAREAGLKVQISRMATSDGIPSSVPEPPIGSKDQSPGSYVLVAGRRILGPLAAMFGPQCLDLGQRLGVVLAAFHFVPAGRNLVLARVDCTPPLAQEEEVDAVVRLAGEEAEGKVLHDSRLRAAR